MRNKWGLSKYRTIVSAIFAFSANSVLNPKLGSTGDSDEMPACIKNNSTEFTVEHPGVAGFNRPFLAGPMRIHNPFLAFFLATLAILALQLCLFTRLPCYQPVLTLTPPTTSWTGYNPAIRAKSNH